MFIVIDKTNLKMVAASSDHDTAGLIAWCDFPDVDISLVNTDDGRSWSLFNTEQMATLYTNMSGQAPTGNYGACVDELRAYGASWPEYPVSKAILQARYNALKASGADKISEADMAELHAKMQREALAAALEANKSGIASDAGGESEKGPITAAPKPAKLPSAPRKPGATGRVWEIADNLVAKSMTDLKEIRKTLMAQCESEGINLGTAGTQFGKWKASKGL